MKILIIGLGSIGKKHVKAIQSVVPDAEIFALRSKSAAEKHAGVTNIYHLDEAERIALDFVIIASPTSDHKNAIAQQVARGLPLFIEKPLYSSLDVEAEVNALNAKGILTYVACNLRFLDCIQFIKGQLPELRNKKLNEVNVYCGSYLPDWRPGDFRNTYSANASLGGGVHIDLIHELDYLYWLFGMPARIGRNFRSQSSLSISSFDYANYLLDYDGFCATVVLNYYRRDTKRSLELVFDDETWSVDLLKNQVCSNRQVIFSSKQIIADTYQRQMEYFIQCVKEKADPFNTVSDAYNVLKICLDK